VISQKNEKKKEASHVEYIVLGMMAQTYTSSTRETEAGRL
jgi:hypothetical protein